MSFIIKSNTLGREILHVIDIAESRFAINRFFSKDNKKNKDSDEALKDMEKIFLLK